MKPDTYFEYIAMLRLNGNCLSMDNLINYVEGKYINEDEKRRARANILQLNRVGFLYIGNELGWQKQTVTLTTLGESVADVIAYIRSDNMIEQSPIFC